MPISSRIRRARVSPSARAGSLGPEVVAEARLPITRSGKRVCGRRREENCQADEEKGGDLGGKGGAGRFSGSGSCTRIKAPPTCSLDEVSLRSQSVSLREKDQRDSPLFCLVQQHRFQTRPARSRGSSGLWRRTDLCLRLDTSRTRSISEERWVMKWKCEKQA